ncbi:hypothetical protein [Cellulophaga omnivescoria]|uniref:hypothetical protein n=1 Tax=Cellulophaga omnivescoria TaxID=1888890 RepID=UPI0011159D78|nr:hypothetical protein [Cellulophaga omnivescoria]WBU88649.1 hypothetical protein PBN93_12305 [Cellulophaga omnivescoria]
MKNLFQKLLLFIFMIALVPTGYSQTKKNDLKILYVGTNPDKPLSDREKSIYTNLERKVALRKTRANDFKDLISKHFNSVTVVYGDDFKEEMAADYDVTIIDTYLTPFAGGYEKDENGKIIGYNTKKYLTENYNAATIMIGEPSAFIGEGRDLKMDHLCLCLDAHAHGMKLDHPIFNTPNKINVTYETKETPANYKARYGGKHLDKTMQMWRIQTEGYTEGKGMPIGLVSTGYAFDNDIDAEWISGGYNSKGVEATAIGRHANFLHWGFAAAPEYLTQSAKLAFINAIHYIAKYKGAKQVTRKIKRIPLRQYLRESQWTVSDEGSAAWLHYINKDTLKMRLEKEKIQAKKDAGKQLSELEKMQLRMPIRKETRIWTIRHEPQYLKEKFGENWAMYENYYKENMDYFYPIPDERYTYWSAVDEDAKALGIANNNIKILETAIAMLTNNDRTEMAKRILKRYTNETFSTAKEWKKWFNKNRKNLYFSEGDGYKYIII